MSEIAEARGLLEAADKEPDPERKLSALEEALDLLEEVSDRAVAANLRRSYTRRLIRQLFMLKKADVLTWFDYARVLLLRLEPEVQAALQADPDLKERALKGNGSFE
ncbi:MAG: hypothetical protein ACT4P4_18855 [Betaproteobacteria bacterium]